MPKTVFAFAEAIRKLLPARDAASVEAEWVAAGVERLGWDALDRARASRGGEWEHVLDEIDGLLLRVLDRLPRFTRQSGPAARRLATFRLPELERLQHATAAALVGHRFGTAGLAAVATDAAAPIARRYYALLTLAGYHAPGHWPLFARYLVPVAHHAFVGTAAEAARYYPTKGAAAQLVRLFEDVRRDQHLRTFLSPRILESLFVLDDSDTLDFFRALLVSGYTAPHPAYCEVTRALVMVRRFTGRLEPNAKFADTTESRVARAIDHAETVFERQRDALYPVAVI